MPLTIEAKEVEQSPETWRPENRIAWGGTLLVGRMPDDLERLRRPQHEVPQVLKFYGTPGEGEIR